VPAPLGTGGIHTVTGALSDEATLELGERAPEDMTVRRQPTRSRAPVPVTLRDGFEAGKSVMTLRQLLSPQAGAAIRVPRCCLAYVLEQTAMTPSPVPPALCRVRADVQFAEYIKGGSQLFSLRFMITLFTHEKAPVRVAVRQWNAFHNCPFTVGSPRGRVASFSTPGVPL
jgi:hypothetical protein